MERERAGLVEREKTGCQSETTKFKKRKREKEDLNKYVSGSWN